MKKEYAQIKRLIVEFDNGHEEVFYSEDYKLKIRCKNIKIKKRKSNND